MVNQIKPLFQIVFFIRLTDMQKFEQRLSPSRRPDTSKGYR